jgi:hypothetical protein
VTGRTWTVTEENAPARIPGDPAKIPGLTMNAVPESRLLPFQEGGSDEVRLRDGYFAAAA